MAKIAKIKRYCISNGEGLRTAVFFSGCPFHCKGCFNKELWDYNYGIEFTQKIKEEIFSSIDDHISGISILGGEPLCKENYDTVLNLCKDFKAAFPNKTIWLWTGYTLDAVPAEILNYIDVLIDGQFIQEKYDYNLKWRGSSNQRILRKRFDLP